MLDKQNIGGEVITKIIDEAIEENENKLFIVYQDFGMSLEKWENDITGVWIFEDLSLDKRKEVWKLFYELLTGLDILPRYSENFSKRGNRQLTLILM